MSTHKILATAGLNKAAPSPRRPRFGDRVVLGATQYRVAASAIGRVRGYYLRPEGTPDAARDRLLTVADFRVLWWNRQRQEWRAT